jgi:coenzyme F420-reducing hydrogenase gamma subunit
VSKPKVAVYKFSSCSGCQQVIINCEDELLDLAAVLDIAYFPEAKRENIPGPYDIGLVEGAISSPEEVHKIKQAREDCGLLIAMGSCAVYGGLPALKNWNSLDQIKQAVYEQPQVIDTLETAMGIDSYVKVDAVLKGCPINKDELFELITSALIGRKPSLRAHSVCIECKLYENNCQLISKDQMCMGPVTSAGCGALCPGNNRPCFGCYGPMSDANASSLGEIFKEHGLRDSDIVRMFRKFTSNADAFRKEAEHYE